MWDEVLGHQQNKEFLQKLLLPGSRPHALLFYGMGGIGKKCWRCILRVLFVYRAGRAPVRIMRKLPLVRHCQ